VHPKLRKNKIWREKSSSGTFVQTKTASATEQGW